VLADRVPTRMHELDFVLIADSIRDPEPWNLAAQRRGGRADRRSFGARHHRSFRTEGRPVSHGAHFRLPLYEISWDEMRTQVGAYGWNVYLADMDGRSCWETEFRRPLGLIISGEPRAPPRPARELAAGRSAFPCRAKPSPLTRPVAGAVLMFEIAGREAHKHCSAPGILDGRGSLLTRMKIRSITYFCNPRFPLNQSVLRRAGDFLTTARSAYEAAGLRGTDHSPRHYSFFHLAGRESSWRTSGPCPRT